MTKWLVPLFAAGLIVAGSPAGMAADAGAADDQLAQGMGPGTGAGSDTRPYGWQIMTGQERAQFQERMRNAQTAEERARIRAENHERMQQRARERGIQLPDEPPSSRGPGSGQGGGQGGGAGQGMGRGGGMMDENAPGPRCRRRSPLTHGRLRSDKTGGVFSPPPGASTGGCMSLRKKRYSTISLGYSRFSSEGEFRLPYPSSVRRHLGTSCAAVALCALTACTAFAQSGITPIVPATVASSLNERRRDGPVALIDRLRR